MIKKNTNEKMILLTCIGQCVHVAGSYNFMHIAEQLGHTETRTTKRYARSSEEVLTKALEDRRAKVIPMRKEK